MSPPQLRTGGTEHHGWSVPDHIRGIAVRHHGRTDSFYRGRRPAATTGSYQAKRGSRKGAKLAKSTASRAVVSRCGGGAVSWQFTRGRDRLAGQRASGTAKPERHRTTGPAGVPILCGFAPLRETSCTAMFCCGSESRCVCRYKRRATGPARQPASGAGRSGPE
jgi:hypothetical protein